MRALADHVRGNLRPTTLDALVALGEILEARAAVRERLDALPATAVLGPAREDVARQLGRLVYPGMLTGTGLARLGDVERYLRAAAQRLERLPDRVAADRERMTTIHELEAQADGRSDVRWLIEEVRVAQLAPGAHRPPRRDGQARPRGARRGLTKLPRHPGHPSRQAGTCSVALAAPRSQAL